LPVYEQLKGSVQLELVLCI